VVYAAEVFGFSSACFFEELCNGSRQGSVPISPVPWQARHYLNSIVSCVEFGFLLEPVRRCCRRVVPNRHTGLRSHPWLGLQVLAQNFVVLWKNHGAGKNHSERRACITSTRAARAAGSIEATTAAPNSTNAETIAGHAPGIFRSPK
jgi:hypothetical protein